MNESVVLGVREEILELANKAPLRPSGAQWQGVALHLCKCTGACKTARCPCYKHNYHCDPSRCKCKVTKCSRQMEKASVDIAAQGEVNSSDEEEQFCVCSDDCQYTSCYCLAIKQASCDPNSCKCDESKCVSVDKAAVTSDPTIMLCW